MRSVFRGWKPSWWGAWFSGWWNRRRFRRPVAPGAGEPFVLVVSLQPRHAVLLSLQPRYQVGLDLTETHPQPFPLTPWKTWEPESQEPFVLDCSLLGDWEDTVELTETFSADPLELISTT